MTIQTVCTNCYYFKFRNKKSMEEHKKLCVQNNAAVKVYPERNAKTKAEPIEGKNVLRYKMPVHISGYLDFEAKMVQKEGSNCTECFQDICECVKDTSQTYHLNSHIPICWSLVMVGENDKVITQKTVYGLDCVEKLFDYLQEIEDELLERIKKFAKCGKLCLNLVPIFKMYKNINIVFILRKY